jgi:S1-C subfamily serine protease
MEKKGTIELILEMLRVFFSWPFIIFLIFLFLINPIRSLIRSWEGKISEISTPVGVVKFVPPVPVGETNPELVAKSPEKAIEELLKSPQQIPNGSLEVFVGRETISRGSGFVVSKDGFVISDTNVLGHKDTAFVKFSGEENVRSAKVIAKNPGNFLALLQLPEGQYPALKLVSAVRIGEKIYKASAKSGLSEGRVIAERGHIKITGPAGPIELNDVIITSAISEPGDSGAPVMNESNKVIGVIVAGSQEKSFLVPASQVVATFPQAFSSDRK